MPRFKHFIFFTFLFSISTSIFGFLDFWIFPSQFPSVVIFYAIKMLWTVVLSPPPYWSFRKLIFFQLSFILQSLTPCPEVIADREAFVRQVQFKKKLRIKYKRMYNFCLEKGSDQLVVTCHYILCLGFYRSVHNQMIRAFFEAHIVTNHPPPGPPPVWNQEMHISSKKKTYSAQNSVSFCWQKNTFHSLKGAILIWETKSSIFL